MYKILSINPGSTSTKFAVYEDKKLICLHTIRHSGDELKIYEHIFDQFEFRKELILKQLEKDEIQLDDFAAIVGRGGMLRPIESGVYSVNSRMISDVRNSVIGEHASNLGCVIAHEIAAVIPGCKAFIADPVSVDELQDVARISGLPGFKRRSLFHALNHKAIARKYAAANGTTYEKLNLVIAHLGGGISVAAHRLGKVVDVNQALDGYGPFSPERSGTLDTGALVRMCFEGKYTQTEIARMLVGNGGLMAHLGTNEAHVAAERAEQGDKYARLVLEAMAYSVAKEIGSMLAVLHGDVDAVILTGGIAYNQFIINHITKMVSHFAKVAVYPGEDEMGALAMAGLRVLQGEMPKEY
ncbi:MAG TPA: butyrate kinase [Paludibacter sp.]|nr:butyrate kinase [Paludibacter sp.]